MRIGSMLTSDDETVELGTYGGRVVRGVVRRRTLRLGWGERPRLALTQLRPLAVEVDGARMHVPAFDARSRLLLQRALLALVASIVVPRLIACMQRRSR
jgi:hypothetical protein